MSKADWDMPKTEEGLQQVLQRLEECRAAGDQVEVGNGLLALSFLVKWVRSDTSATAFDRSHELALEAVEVFRNAQEAKGLVRSLVSASAIADPRSREQMLSEAEALAEGPGDDYVAMALAAKARALAMRDPDQAAQLHRRVLEIYRCTGNKQGQAQCLFSLAIGSESSTAKRDRALEGARLYRELGDPAGAARCVSLALMNAEKIQPLCELEELAREGLQDALTAGNRSKEGLFYGKLVPILASKGEYDEAAKYRRWSDELQEADGLMPFERWQQKVEMTRMFASTAKSQGNKEMAKVFQDEVKRLKADNPKS